jgi:hypothetical protein
MRFDLKGLPARQRTTACQHCGAMEHCEDCWDAVCDYTPFMIWHCLLCRMATFFYEHAGELTAKRCDYCGWDEATECSLMTYHADGSRTARRPDGSVVEHPP